jgi:CrcB protein
MKFRIQNEKLKQYLAVAVGGILGALMRETIEMLMRASATDQIPVATLLINWVGSFLLAWFYTISIWKYRIPQWIRVGIGTGFIGAFTTFSTFSVESLNLLQQNIGVGVMYIASSMLGGFGAIWLGIRLAGEEPAEETI